MVTLDQAGSARPWTRIVPAPPSLAPFVEFFWAQATTPGRTRTLGWRIVPDAAPHLIVKRLDGSEGDTMAAASATLASVVGARSRYVDSDTPRRLWTAGARFRPGTLPLLTGLPATEFADRGVPLADVLGNAGRRLHDGLARAADADEAIRVLRDALAARLASAAPPDSRIRGLFRLARAGNRNGEPAGPPSVRAVADALGVPTRTLRQRCADDVGLPPVRLLRVARLHDALRLAVAGQTAGGWATIAVRTGYFDQSHLIRDFRLLLGEPPRDFMRRSGT